MAKVESLSEFSEAGWDVETLSSGWVADQTNGEIAITVAFRGDTFVMSLEDEASGEIRDFKLINDDKMTEYVATIIEWQPKLTTDDFRELPKALVADGATLSVRINGEFVLVRDD